MAINIENIQAEALCGTLEHQLIFDIPKEFLETNPDARSVILPANICRKCVLLKECRNDVSLLENGEDGDIWPRDGIESGQVIGAKVLTVERDRDIGSLIISAREAGKILPARTRDDFGRERNHKVRHLKINPTNSLRLITNEDMPTELEQLSDIKTLIEEVLTPAVDTEINVDDKLQIDGPETSEHKTVSSSEQNGSANESKIVKPSLGTLKQIKDADIDAIKAFYNIPNRDRVSLNRIFFDGSRVYRIIFGKILSSATEGVAAQDIAKMLTELTDHTFEYIHAITLNELKRIFKHRVVRERYEIISKDSSEVLFEDGAFNLEPNIIRRRIEDT
jgi:hypothetical protein